MGLRKIPYDVDNSDRVDSCHVNDSGTSTSDLWTASKITNATWTKIAETTLSSDASSVSFSSIPSGYTSFRVEFQARASSTTLRDLRMTFNSDSTLKYGYSYYRSSYNNIFTTNNQTVNADNFFRMINALPVNADNNYSEGSILVSNSSVIKKAIIGNYVTFGLDNGNIYPQTYTTGGQYSVTTEISTITLTASADDIGTNSHFVLWGYK
jgi:hypothetical protein